MEGTTLVTKTAEWIDVEDREGLLIFTLKRPFFLGDEDSVRIGQIISAHRHAEHRFVVDFSNVQSLRPTCLQHFRLIAKKHLRQKRTIVFCAVNPDIRRVILMMRFEELVLFYPNKEEALRAIIA